MNNNHTCVLFHIVSRVLFDGSLVMKKSHFKEKLINL